MLRASHFVHHANSYWLILLPPYAVAMVSGPVVGGPISVNPRLNCNLDFFIPLFKSIFGTIFCVLFYIYIYIYIYSRQKEIQPNFLWKLSDLILISDFTLTTQPWVFQDGIKSFSLLFINLMPKPDFGHKASLCNSLAVISSQAWSQHMNITFKGSMSEVARKTRRWKLDIAGRNSLGGNWFKYLNKPWKSCTQGKRKKHRITQTALKYRAKYNFYLT